MAWDCGKIQQLEQSAGDLDVVLCGPQKQLVEPRGGDVEVLRPG
ncbi:hypothetical protein [Streptomyces hokutonensis]